MSDTFRDRAKRYHRAVRRALLEEWDLIGVRDVPEAQDEYDSYVPQVYKLLIQRKPGHEIFDFLWWLETEHMGLSGNRGATKRFAERLLEISVELESNDGPKLN